MRYEASKAAETLRRGGPAAFVKKLAGYLAREYRFLRFPYASVGLDHLGTHEHDSHAASLLDRLYEVVGPFQSRAELLALLELMAERKPKVILDIGTAYGGTLFWFCRAAPDDAVLISMDLPGKIPAHRARIYRRFARHNQKVHLVQADSHGQAALDRIRAILGGRPIDFIFIDGDHSYEGVAKDHEMYGPLVGLGGLIAFHDILLGGGQVKEYWHSIKDAHRTQELVEDPHRTEFGIGVLFVE